VGLHAKHAITSINTSYPASMLATALTYTVRWDVGIAKQDFLSRELEGERWLVWAAGSVRFYPVCGIGLSRVSDARKAVLYLRPKKHLQPYCSHTRRSCA